MSYYLAPIFFRHRNTMNTCQQPAVATDSIDADAAPSAPSGDGDDSPSAQRAIAIEADDPLLAERLLPHADWLTDRLAAACDVLSLDQCELSVIVINDDRMAELHERFSGVAGTTDVLTFDLSDDTAASTHVEGEIYVCLDEAHRQAEQRGHATERELLLYAVHGLLHLVGYDDHDEADYQTMHAREDELLEAIGVGRLFSGDGEMGGGA